MYIMRFMKLKELDIISLKKSGYMKQRQKDLFSVRLRVPCGNLTSEQLKGIGKISEKYGRGKIHITTRQGLQIPDVDINNLDAITYELVTNHTPPGSFGSRVRNIVACPGNNECNRGIIDTYGLGDMLDKEFFGEDMPSKMKFAVAGCPNACAKPQENDIVVMGIHIPMIHLDECIGCGICTANCAEKAIVVMNEKAMIIWNNCKSCGLCIDQCPHGSISEDRKGFKIFVGGKVGRNPKPAREFGAVWSPGEVVSVIRNIINWSKKNTIKGERFGDCLDRVGFEKFRQDIMNIEIYRTTADENLLIQVPQSQQVSAKL